jgi:glycerol kinase
MQKDAKIEFSALKVDGGATGNNLLMQIQSDLLQKVVVRPNTTETTALGAAFFAGLAVGFWKDQEELKSIWKEDHTFFPEDNPNTERILSLWLKRIPKVLKTHE